VPSGSGNLALRHFPLLSTVHSTCSIHHDYALARFECSAISLLAISNSEKREAPAEQCRPPRRSSAARSSGSGLRRAGWRRGRNTSALCPPRMSRCPRRVALAPASGTAQARTTRARRRRPRGGAERVGRGQTQCGESDAGASGSSLGTRSVRGAGETRASAGNGTVGAHALPRPACTEARQAARARA
jgi:hypothetical protein